MFDWESFRRSLRGHDWYFDMSDDHKVWSNGMANLEKLRALKRKADEENYERATKLWNSMGKEDTDVTVS